MSSSMLSSALLALLFFQCLSSVNGKGYTLATPEEVRDLLAVLERSAMRQTKRAPHNIDTRALNQFKNCYFSPIQCVLMERRR